MSEKKISSNEVDPEDKSTEIWTPIAKELFPPDSLKPPEPEEHDTDRVDEGEDPTLLVGQYRKLKAECRICGKKIQAPRPRWFRGSVRGADGFSCEKCGNVFCAGHVIRISGLWHSIRNGALFKCVLCMPGNSE